MIRPIIDGACHNFYVFIGIQAATLGYPFVRPAARQQGTKYAYLFLVGACLFFAFLYLLILSNTGPGFLVQLQWHGVSALRLVSVAGLIVDKLGVLVVVLWGLFVLAFLAVRLWAVSHYIGEIFSWNAIGPYRLALTAATLLVGIGAQVIANITILTEVFQEDLLAIFMVYLYAVPLILIAGYAPSATDVNARPRRPAPMGAPPRAGGGVAARDPRRRTDPARDGGIRQSATLQHPSLRSATARV